MKRFVTMTDVLGQAAAVAKLIKNNLDVPRRHFYGVPRGGIPAMLAVINHLPGAMIVDKPEQADWIIDDIYDSGATHARYPHKPFAVLFDKREAPWRNQWLVMPWEVTAHGVEESGDDIITRLLQYIGEDTTREGLQETPQRVLKAWKEWATGYDQDPNLVLSKCFTDGARGCDELVIVHNIPVVSKCEHHLADIIGHAHIGYIPNGKIVGLSKLARLVEVFSRRLQVQERLTVQIADCMVDNLQPVGVGVLIRAAHACMSTRGVKIHGSVTTTSAMRGALMDKVAARQEFLDLCRMAEQDRAV